LKYPTQQSNGPYEFDDAVSRRFQNIQDFRDQYMAMRKVYDELGLRFGRCKDDV